MQQYYIFMVLKDFSILVSQLFCGGFLGFWHALVLHVITLPVDILVLLGLSIWGTVVLNQDGTDACRLDEICLPLARLVHLNVVLGYAYILINLFLKPLLLGLFCFCLGGIRLMHKDEAEEKDWQLRSLQGKVISGLHSGTFSSIYGAISPRPKRRQRRDAASRRRPPTQTPRFAESDTATGNVNTNGEAGDMAVSPPSRTERIEFFGDRRQ